MTVEVQIVDAFIYGESGGNPAGVVLDADHFSESRMQEIACEMGLSETVFVGRSEKADFKLDFFTPNTRVGDCGHATVAAFSLLKTLGKLRGEQTSKELVHGVRDIFVKGDAIYMEQQAPQYIPLPDYQGAIAESLGLELADFAAPCEAVNTGESFLMVPLKSLEAVKAARPDQDQILALSQRLDLIGYYVFAAQGQEKEHQAGARMFAPRYAIDEESATGMAAGPCACFLRDRLGQNREAFKIEQGWLMDPPSPSLLHAVLEVTDGRITSLRVGGKGRLRKTVTVEA